MPCPAKIPELIEGDSKLFPSKPFRWPRAQTCDWLQFCQVLAPLMTLLTKRKSRPSGKVVNDTDCRTVGPGFESLRCHGCFKCIVPSRHEGTLNYRRAASPLVRLVERLDRWEDTDHS
ncbi:hypothetical protein TNCV_3077361 [Trichonephila clavipes]|nr:hypothetical protein TNCV_3077361 [Trichonephila clavipes]